MKQYSNFPYYCMVQHVDSDLNAQDKEGNTPLLVAALWGHVDLVAALARKGARCDISNIYGETVYAFTPNKQAIKV